MDIVGDLPDLIPARMLNEFVYCPRLFYLEWVEQEWFANDDTAEGEWVHRRVDAKRGNAYPPQEGVWPSETYSVTLADVRIGVTAVVDRIDAAGGKVSPIDYKKGRPRGDGTPWPADLAQVEAHGALLRSAGYECSEGWLYYAQTHERVSVPLNASSDARVAALVEQAKAVARRPVAPLPLEDSRRCIRCSLAPACLPDEINVLRGRRAARDRTILPRRPDQRPLYVTEPGATIGIQHGQVVVRLPAGDEHRARLIDVSHVAAYGNAQVSTQALTKLWASGIPVLWLSHGGWLKGWASGQPRKNVAIRREQARPQLRHHMLAQRFVAGKIRNQRVLLRRNARGVAPEVLESLASLARGCLDACSANELMGLEGTAARLYFEAFPRMLIDSQMAEVFGRQGRVRRPATDPVNAALGFAYALLTKELVVACLAVGLDPYLGMLHADRFGRPSMALDFMEEFRPLIADSVVLQALNTKEVGWKDFRLRGTECSLTQDGRRSLIRAFERRLDSEVRHPLLGYRVSYRRVIDVQVRLAAAMLVGEVDEYVAMGTR